MRHGKGLWAANEKDWKLPLTKTEKVWTGLYLILRDFGQGEFPPAFTDQQQTYLNEINYHLSIPGMTSEEVIRGGLTKPFWSGDSLPLYLKSFLKLAATLEQEHLAPPAKLLELGGGTGWMAEFLAQLGFKVVSTTIAPQEVETARKRAEALRVKGVPHELHFLVAPMESVAREVQEHCPFDAVFVFEALHHAFDWKAALRSAYACLRPGGRLLICNEPNVLHTAVSYRVAKLSHTHEIGFSKKELTAQLKAAGFRRVTSVEKKPHFFFRAHWLVAEK